MNKCVLIFDFDGTIADTHHYICHISNQLCDEFKYNRIDFDNLDYMKTLSAKDAIRYLEVPFMKVPKIIKRAKQEFQKGLKDLHPFEGIKDILEQLKTQVTSIGILSSNNTENVTQFLDLHDISLFDFIHTTSKVWSKNVSLNKLIHHHKLNKEDVIYVGDETRDIVAAQKLGIKIAAVSWGYNSKETLAKHNPDYLLEKPEDLLTLCS